MIVNKNRTVVFWLIFVLPIMMGIFFINTDCLAQSNVRKTILLNKNWKSIAFDSINNSITGFENVGFDDNKWKAVNVPHTWDTYEGYRRMKHGNRHGYAFYRKSFSLVSSQINKHFFLFFEGVGSYATVWLNNKKVGYHAGGRTTFTLDVTHEIYADGRQNILSVRADHPANIVDLPWVCGGCSDERGFSEGSQPMGIFRPVQLIITDEIRIEPFGVHIWNDTSASNKSAVLNIETEIKNYGDKNKSITVINKLIDIKGTVVFELKSIKNISAGNTVIISQQTPTINNPHLWSLVNPYLYQFISEVWENRKLIDKVSTPYGIRTINWPIGANSKSKQFLLNGKPVFINGIAEYEHELGNSHAFSDEQIHTRAMQVKAAGFNAFRDAHQPHNLRYQNYWDSLGILWWPQLSAHIWFDTPAFRDNFKTLLKDWVKERRNSPSVVLWGLQNESKLPADFAKECSQIIRELDPTASSQREITTCNGGEGTDWNVPQNWTGTYGGNPATYGDDVKRQVLIGEYGAWRTLDLHTEGGFQQNGALSEDRMTQLMEMKIRLAEQVKDSTAGQFFWLLTSHDNPGRVQGGEGLRELDRIGPVNYKGLLTPWEEPLDVFYMFRSNYAPKATEPMVYIVSHTWPDRWLTTGKKDSIIVYSNCDEVELFNDVNNSSLGKRKRGEIGTHFQWDNVLINYNVLYAIGYVNGKAVAKDYITLNHLPQAPHFNLFNINTKPITAPKANYNYLYRVNCGGANYTDKQGNTWLADREVNNDKTWGSTSWSNDFKGMPPFFASQRSTHDPIVGTQDWPLFQSFRYGRERLKYTFPVPDGDYLVELYFTEPWLGTGGGMDCTGWRKFDITINDKIAIKSLDIWKECSMQYPFRGQGQIASGHDAALKRTIIAHIKGGHLNISFANILSGQAIVSAIAIASLNKQLKPANAADLLIKNISVNDGIKFNNWPVETWMNNGDKQYKNDIITFSALPSTLYAAEWLSLPKKTIIKEGETLVNFTLAKQADVYVAMDASIQQKPIWLNVFDDTKTILKTDENGGKNFNVYRKRFNSEMIVSLGNNGTNATNNASMYTVAVCQATTIEPAYDLKTAITYKAPQAKLSGDGLVKKTINEKDAVLFTKDKGDTIEWKIPIGAADTYSLTIKYANPSKETLTGTIQLLAADGTIMREINASFLPSATGKWNYFDTSTGTMINAGNYKIKLISINAEGLGISGIDVQ